MSTTVEKISSNKVKLSFDIDAAQFDAAPDYRGDALRFVSGGEPAGIYDDLGATAMDGVRKIVRDLDDAELLEWWKELDKDEA